MPNMASKRGALSTPYIALKREGGALNAKYGLKAGHAFNTIYSLKAGAL